MTDLHIEVVDRAIAVVTETLPRISTHGGTHTRSERKGVVLEIEY